MNIPITKRVWIIRRIEIKANRSKPSGANMKSCGSMSGIQGIWWHDVSSKGLLKPMALSAAAHVVSLVNCLWLFLSKCPLQQCETPPAPSDSWGLLQSFLPIKTLCIVAFL